MSVAPWEAPQPLFPCTSSFAAVGGRKSAGELVLLRYAPTGSYRHVLYTFARPVVVRAPPCQSGEECRDSLYEAVRGSRCGGRYAFRTNWLCKLRARWTGEPSVCTAGSPFLRVLCIVQRVIIYINTKDNNKRNIAHGVVIYVIQKGNKRNKSKFELCVARDTELLFEPPWEPTPPSGVRRKGEWR